MTKDQEMTHDKALKILSEIGSPIGEYGLMTKSDAQDIAELLDLYRTTLVEAREDMLQTNPSCEQYGIAEFDVGYIDEVLA